MFYIHHHHRLFISHSSCCVCVRVCVVHLVSLQQHQLPPLYYKIDYIVKKKDTTRNEEKKKPSSLTLTELPEGDDEFTLRRRYKYEKAYEEKQNRKKQEKQKEKQKKLIFSFVWSVSGLFPSYYCSNFYPSLFLLCVFGTPKQISVFVSVCECVCILFWPVGHNSTLRLDGLSFFFFFFYVT